MAFVARGHPQQLAHRDPALTRLPGFELPDVAYDIDDRSTDPAEFAKLDARFHFNVDACAAAHNHKTPAYWDVGADGLAQSWSLRRVWCNPPYSNIRPWVEKAWAEWRSDLPPGVIVMLLPANRTEQSWWQELVEPYRDHDYEDWGVRCEFLPGRMRFIAPGADRIGPNERPPFGCCLLIWDK